MKSFSFCHLLLVSHFRESPCPLWGEDALGVDQFEVSECTLPGPSVGDITEDGVVASCHPPLAWHTNRSRLRLQTRSLQYESFLFPKCNTNTPQMETGLDCVSWNSKRLTHSDAVWLVRHPLHCSGISKEGTNLSRVLANGRALWNQCLSRFQQRPTACRYIFCCQSRRGRARAGWGGGSWVEVTGQGLSKRASPSQPDFALLQARPSLYWILRRHHQQR